MARYRLRFLLQEFDLSRGETLIGRGLYPKPPDMTAGGTQQLTDGELYTIIENGVRFTGMPAFGEEAGYETWASKARTLGELIAALWLPAMIFVTSESSSRRSTSSTAGFQTREIRRSIDSTPP